MLKQLRDSKFHGKVRDSFADAVIYGVLWFCLIGIAAAGAKGWEKYVATANDLPFVLLLGAHAGDFVRLILAVAMLFIFTTLCGALLLASKVYERRVVEIWTAKSDKEA